VYSSCPVCESTEIYELANISEMPVYCNVLHANRGSALGAAKGDIGLVFCKQCTHVFNQAFDPEQMAYSVEYENSLHYSGVFSEFSEQLAQGLVREFNLNDKNIIEIGCGKGDFLHSLCSKGNSSGVGFDKSFDATRFDKAEMPNVTIRQEFYDENHAEVPVDFLCSRHVLEHIQYPVDFLKTVTRVSTAEANFDVYIEVPNGLFTLRDFGVWDIIYEHCSYFTPVSLAECFHRAGCGVTSLEETFSGQFLSLKGRRFEGQVAGLEGDGRVQEYLKYAVSFNEQYQALKDSWHNKLEDYLSSGKKVVIWGAGSKGVTFLNVFGSASNIDYAVDLNPHKIGMYVPGGGQEVVAPGFLTSYGPDVIIVMNPVYLDEIASQVQALGVEAEIVVV